MGGEHVYTAKEILENHRAELADSPMLASQVESLKRLTPAEQTELLYLMIHSWGDTMLREMQKLRETGQWPKVTALN